MEVLSKVSAEDRQPQGKVRPQKRHLDEQRRSPLVESTIHVVENRHTAPLDELQASTRNEMPTSPAKRPKRSRRRLAGGNGDKENTLIGLSDAGLLASAEDVNDASYTTPTKSRQPQEDDDPLTPTTNLKVLLSAISPALRDREAKRRKGLVFVDSEAEKKQTADDADREIEKGKEKPKRLEYSRKDKSLARLCSRFLDLFDKDENVGKKIYLDNAAKQLGVERRRVYDIVNVLESLEIAKREAKNQYQWKGRSQLPATVTKLKAHALQKGLMPKMDLQQSEELSVETIRANIQKLPAKTGNASDSENEEVAKSVDEKQLHKRSQTLFDRRDRSLGCLTQRFLMLFFVSDTRIVGLDVAALILIGNMSPESARWKTKVRRLYDIANILSSLQLIKKVRLPLRYGMKPAYQWVGTELDTAAQHYVAAERLPTVCKPSARKRMYSKKHTLLDGFEAIPLPNSESTDTMEGSQNSADLNSSSQQEVPHSSCSGTDTSIATELQTASALMQLKTGQLVVPTPTQVVAPSMTTTSKMSQMASSASDPKPSSKPTVLTVMQTSMLPSGQSLLVPMATNPVNQQPATAVILPPSQPNSTNKTQQSQDTVQQPSKPIFLSFLPSSQLQSGPVLPTIPVFRVAMPVTSTQTVAVSQSPLPQPSHTRPTPAFLPQPVTMMPSPTLDLAQAALLANPSLLTSQFIASRHGPKPIAPKGSPPSNTFNVKAQLDAIRELLAQDNEAYETLIERQHQSEPQKTIPEDAQNGVSASPINTLNMPPNGIATFPVNTLTVVPVLSSPTVQSPPTFQMASPQQQIELLQKEIERQSGGESSPTRKLLHFHQYTPQKQHKDLLQFHQIAQQTCRKTQTSVAGSQDAEMPISIREANLRTDGDLTVMSPYSAAQAGRLTCQEQLSPATPRRTSFPGPGLQMDSGLHAKRWQRTKSYPPEGKRVTDTSSTTHTTPVKSATSISHINLSTLPVFQRQPAFKQRHSLPSMSLSAIVPISHSHYTPSTSSFLSCGVPCSSDSMPVFSVSQDDQAFFRTVAGHGQSAVGFLSGSPLWSVSQQRET